MSRRRPCVGSSPSATTPWVESVSGVKRTPAGCEAEPETSSAGPSVDPASAARLTRCGECPGSEVGSGSSVTVPSAPVTRVAPVSAIPGTLCTNLKMNRACSWSARTSQKSNASGSAGIPATGAGSTFSLKGAGLTTPVGGASEKSNPGMGLLLRSLVSLTVPLEIPGATVVGPS